MNMDVDVLVAGGGIAGTMAAIAAAREGCRTLLVERYAALGGMATLGLVQPMTTWGIRGTYVVGGTGKQILEGLAERAADAATPMNHYGPCCDAEWLKFELERQASDAGVHLLYHTWVQGVDQDGDRVTSVKAFSKEGPHRFGAQIVVDATGDADLAAAAGVPCEVGTQGISLMFVVGGIDRARCPDRNAIGALYAEHKVGYRGLALFWHPRPGWAYFNVTEVENHGALNVQDLTRATIECRRQAWAILDVMQHHVPGFERAFIAETASALGVRESRRIRGCYTLTGQDAAAGRHFDDAVARASCPIDIHGSHDGGRGHYEALQRSYAIPYRALVAPELANLLVTGRPISADHAAHSSLRRMAPGFALGEAAGMAAAIACQTGCDVRMLNTVQLQDRLRRRGAILDPEP